MILFERLKKTFVYSVFLCLCPLLSFADVSCPSGYVKISESDSIIVTNSSSCPSGHTKLSDVSGNISVTNCTTGLSSGFCTYYSESCQSGKYFDGTTHKTCIAGSYCDGTGTATPGVSGCSKACPENSTSTSGATSCTCNDGYYMVDGVCEICPIGSYCANNTKTACDTGYNTDNTGASTESQCYTTCEQQCTQQTCPDNATCTHGTTTTTGKQYVGGTCDASASQCEITVTCNSGYLLTDGECVQIEFEPEFTITTTKLSADTTFRFTLAAAGTFYINWGDGNIKVIEKTTVAEEVIEHTYADSGTYTIGLAGDATGYNAGINTSSIRFSHDTNSDVNGWKYIAGIDGSLGAIFGTIENPTLTSQSQPRFRYTFSGCTNLTSAIPPELFNGIYGAPVDRMFMGVFNECSKMSGTLPSELFADLSGQITENMFRQSFNSCASLTGSIPADFFGGLSGELRNSSLYRTFYGCSKLSGYIEPALFANFTESSTATSQMTGVFTNTGLDTVCPANTYNYDNVFNDYFDGRVSCSPCPDNGLSVSGENYEISACYLDAICSDVGQGTQQCNYNTTTDEYTDCTTCIYTSCNSGYELVDGACEMISFEPEFTITTTEIPANTEFTFKISAAGMYYIDWGDGTIEPIEKTNLTNTPYSHKYELKGTYEIKLAGQATGYNSDVNTSAIDFSGNTYIAGIDGSLGAIFGTLENPTFNTKTQPRFRYTFSGCTNLASAIPPELFSGIYGAPTDRMFMAMFNGCSKLSGTLPANLFAGMSGQITENMFRQMFYGCSSLSGPIPSGLFGDLSGQLQTSSFLRTFSGCTSLDGYIPPDLFAKFTRPSTMSGQMTEIFYNTKLDTACPVNMYQYKTGYEEFFNSHVACTPCPDGYSSESGSTSESQCYTTCEVACTQQTCPDNATCTHGTTTTTGKQYVGGTCDASASQCELNITCNTGYELKDGTCSAIMCESGYYLDGNECIICPIGSYCANNIKTACDTGYTTDNTGASTESQCYTTCEQQCTQQTCPDNATCTHGTTTTTGKQYVGGTCDASASQCELNITCDTGYELKDGTCSAIVCASGYYLDGNECIICPIGSYCANNIKTACDTGYNTDNTGASTESQCYTTCEVACTQQTCPDNATCTHGTTTTTGKQYVGGTCDATASQCELTVNCATGYELINGTCSAIVCEPGYYLDGNECIICPIGSYCANNTKTACDTGYNTDNTGATSESQCYTTCEQQCTQQTCPDNATCTHGTTTTTGKQYVGSTCDAAASQCELNITCDTGYELKDSTCSAIVCESGYYLDGNECIICPIGSYCANNIKTACDTGYNTDNTGASTESQCYTTCEVACTQQTCPDNATCTHGATTTTGKQYVGGTCNAEQTTCEINFKCNENFELIDGECKFKPEFTITTINMSDDTTFMFALSAAGNYVIDWGDGNVELINKTDTARESVWHTYKKGGIYTIGLSGQATKYSDVKFIAAIDFGNNTAEVVEANAYKYIAAIDGRLGAIFSGNTANMFYKTFSGCSHLTTVPKTLFDGVTGSAEYMFANTFFECTNLKTLPENLFAGLYGSAEHMFNSTFARCSALENIPKDLFATISGNALNLFSRTFSYCSALRSIPEELFSSLSGNAMYMFEYTFFNCTSLTEIPKGLFASLSGGATGMFAWTFGYCRKLTSIPSELFATITDSWENMFYLTFAECTSLQSIPDGLFKNITGKPKYQEFDSVFRGCTNLSGYIPVDMFEKLDGTDFNNSSMWGIFADTKLAESCPANMYQIITGFESAWSNKVMCGTCPDGTLSIAGSVGIESCKKPEPVEVVITTTEMQPNSEFWFYISASGTFFVDWGDGTIELIERPELSSNQYKHKYLAPGVYKIGLSGSATGYADNYCVGFMGNQYVNEVDGSLIDVFGILSDGTNPKFTYSFASCNNLSKISKDLFAGYNGGTEQMFSSTFTSTYSLKEIPEGLFDSITTAAPGMFDITFASSGLTSLPSGMFKNITGKPEPNMFRSTFAAVNDLQGYVPANMFENMDSVDYESGPMTAIFYGTNLAEQCPENMYQYKTGFEVDWSDKVACTPCPAGTTSFAGASGIEQCTGPKSLHIGDDIQMNLTTVKPSTPRVMVFDVLGDLYYGGLSETAKPINKNTDKQFRIYDPESDKNYWMHDYTVQ